MTETTETVRRPLFYGIISFTAAILVMYYAGTAAGCAAAVAFAGALAAAKKARGPVTGALAISAAFFIAGTAAYQIHDAFGADITAEAGGTADLTVKISQVKERGGDESDEEGDGYGSGFGSGGVSPYKATARVLAVNGKSIRGPAKVLLTYYPDKTEAERGGTAMIPGDVLSVRGEAEKPRGRRNPGCFDYRLYLESVGINDIIRVSDIKGVESSGRGTLPGMAYTAREDFLTMMEKSAGSDTAGMMGAVMFGEKEGLDEDVLEEFRKNGTAHILAVSGLHIGIIYGVIAWLWRWKKGRLYFAAVMGFFVFYTAMASFAVSVVRAVVMIGLHIFAKVSGRRYDMSSAAFLTALVMLAAEPMMLFNTGFQMSFIAVLSMALIMPLAGRIFRGAMLAAVSVQAGLIPYIAYVFNYLSAAALLVNIPVVFLAGIIVPMGLAAVFVSMVSGYVPVENVFSRLCDALSGLCGMLTTLNHMTTREGVSVFTVTSPDIRLIAAYYASCVFFLSEEGRLVVLRRKKAAISMLVCAVFAVSAAFGHVADSGFRDADIVFVDVGQGDCIHLRTGDGKNYMIDGGGSVGYNVGKNTLKPYLLKNGVRRLDGVFVTHLHTDHYKGIKELCDEGMVKKLFLYEGNRVKEREILEETGLRAGDITYLSKGTEVKLSEGVSIDVLWPERKTQREYERMAEDDEDENGSCLVFKVNMGEHSVIADGDIDTECQKTLAELYGSFLKCDILKAAHHGSKYSNSDEFLDAASPRYGVFQVGKNNFGHPDKGVVENYRGRGIIVYRNDEDGAAGFELADGGAVRVMTVRGGEKRR